jgi:hypothetical protein
MGESVQETCTLWEWRVWSFLKKEALFSHYLWNSQKFELFVRVSEDVLNNEEHHQLHLETNATSFDPSKDSLHFEVQCRVESQLLARQNIPFLFSSTHIIDKN